MKRLLILALIFAVITILPHSINGLPGSVFAQSSKREIIRVSPFIFDLTLSPSKTYTYDMTIENLLDIPVSIRISTEDFQVSEESGDYTFEKNNTNSIISWVSIDPKEMILEPKEKQVVTVTVNTPEKISFGGYHGMIFIEPLFPNQKQFNSLLTTKIGALILTNIGSPVNGVHPALISDYTIPFIVFDRNSLDYTFKVKSNSLHHFTARPFLHIRSFFENEQKIALEEKLIFPGKTRFWDGTASIQDLLPGFYTGQLRVSLGNGIQTVATKYFFYLPPYIIIMIAVAITLTFLVKKMKLLRKCINFIKALFNRK